VKRQCLAIVLAAVLALAFAAPAMAGGWASVTLDQVPSDLRAGDTHRVGYTILQHGITPFRDSSTFIRARSNTGETATFRARPDGADGHYLAEVRFPSAGSWTWEVVPEPFAPQSLGAIAVTNPTTPSDAAPVILSTAKDPSPSPSALVLRVALTLATLLAGAAFAVQVSGFTRRPVAPRSGNVSPASTPAR